MAEKYNEFLEILQAMEQEKVDYVLVGGFAIIIHGMPRHTMDIDLFVKMERDNIAKLRKALDTLYGDPDIAEITYQELSRYPVIRYGTPTGVAVDIMTEQGEVVKYGDLEFEKVEIEGQVIRLATPETLFMMKSDTVRAGDKQDAMFCKQLISRRKHDQ